MIELFVLGFGLDLCKAFVFCSRFQYQFLPMWCNGFRLSVLSILSDAPECELFESKLEADQLTQSGHFVV